MQHCPRMSSFYFRLPNKKGGGWGRPRTIPLRALVDLKQQTCDRGGGGTRWQVGGGGWNLLRGVLEWAVFGRAKFQVSDASSSTL